MPGHAWTDTAPSDSAVQAMLASGGYRGGDYVKMNRAPYASALSDATPMDIDVYVSKPDWSEYALVQPEHTHTDMWVPPGLTVVRVVEDATGQPEKLTVMVRHSDGYFPGGGDFCYGVTTLEGAPIKWGKLEECASCHAQRAGDAWLFGVPSAMR